MTTLWIAHRRAAHPERVIEHRRPAGEIDRRMDALASDPLWWAKFEWMPPAAERFRGYGPTAGVMRVEGL